MTRDKFIKKWLANPQKEYNEYCKDEMRDDLDRVVEYAQSELKNIGVLENVMPCYLLQKACDVYYGAYDPVKLFKTEEDAINYAKNNNINYQIDKVSF
jgi:hypothetical protein